MIQKTWRCSCREVASRSGIPLLALALVSSGLAPRASAATLVTTNVQSSGTDWNAAIWRTNGVGAATSPAAGNVYQCRSNGVPFGINAANTRIRTPTSGVATFAGDSLTLFTNTELRIKGSASGPLLNFPGVGGGAGLVLDGGIVNVGDNAVFTITGRLHVTSYGFICPGDGGGGAVQPLRGVNLAGRLSGPGTLIVFQAGTTVAQQISGNENTFTGSWVVKAGWLLGAGQDSLGTNNITIDPGYKLPLEGSIQNVAGPAWFEPGYDLNSAGRLTLTNGGRMILHQACAFASAVIEGVTLAPGIHTYAQLAASFPSNFAANGSGSITIRPYGPQTPVPPVITQQPLSCTLDAGAATQLVAQASGGSLSYRWQKGTNNLFVNLANGGNVSGADSSVLRFSSLVMADAAEYRLVATNTAGSATSQVATVTVLTAADSRPFVARLSPADGATLGGLTQIQVTFNEPVVNVAAADLLISGFPAGTVSGSGSNYVFVFNQPAPGLVAVSWDFDNSIADLGGHPLNASGSWSYTLADTLPPLLVEIVPAPGSVLGALSRAQVTFAEPVTGVGAADLRVNGAVALGVTGSGAGPYEFQFAPAGQGQAQLAWAADHGIADVNSNPFAGGGWAVTVNSAAAAAAQTNIVVNEFLAANAKAAGLRDEDGELSDWIELRNRGSASVNLAGWSLTDSPDLPRKWTFPATNLGPGQFLVVLASGKDRRVAGARLHTNFELNSGGDYLGLFGPDLPPQVAHDYTPEFPQQRNDVSFGLDAGGARKYFSVPTPGANNGFSVITGLVASVHFSVKHGYFDRPFNLHLTTTTPGATVVYTTDGSPPDDAGRGTIYSGPLAISRTTVLRAVAFAPGRLPSAVETRTYLFVEDVVRQPKDPAGYPTGYVWTPNPGTVQNGSRAHYEMSPAIVNDPQYSNSVRSGLLSIPTLSLVLPVADLFDPVTGIYTHPEQRGAAWERGCSMELIGPDSVPGLQLDCGLQIQGGTQRDPNKNPKHSFRVSFKGDYGAGRLEHAFFPDSAVDSFNTLVLDSGMNMWWHYVGGSSPADQRYRAQCVRDQYASDLLAALGQPACHGRFCHVYLNGLYWGIHYVHERPDEEFASSYFGGGPAEFDVLRTTTAGLEVVAGNRAAWDAALALSNPGLADNGQYLQLRQFVDVENLIDYMIVNHWICNEDWPQHNWYVIRRRAPGEGFKFISWDAEHVLKSPNGNRTTANSTGTPAQIYNALRDNAEFRLLFADRLQKHFFNGGAFYTDPAYPRYDPARPERNVPASLYLRRIREIDTAIVDESARWGGYLLTTNYTRNQHWVRELDNLLGSATNAGNTANFFPGRTATVLGQYKAIGLFPGVNAPAFTQYGGPVPAGFALGMSNPNSGGTIYYTTNGADPRVFGSGAVSPQALVYSAPVALGTGAVIKARVLQNGTWSALVRGDFSVAELGVPLRITEIMYRPVGGDAYEFLELQNAGATPLDLSGFSFQGITFLFPDNSAIAAGGIIVLASDANPVEFAKRYPGVTVFGYYSGALFNNGERIALLDRAGATVVSVEYDHDDGWPTAADNGGHSLEMVDASGDPDDPANWRASLMQNGSPGLANEAVSLPSVRLNEVMADNAGAVTNGGSFPDWLELHNAGSAAVNLAGWSLSNNGDPRRFVFPTGTTLSADSYLVIWCDSATNAPGFHAGFALGRKGETVYLFDPQTNRVDAVGFGLQAPNYTLGRLGPEGAWRLTQPTPGAQNQPAAAASATNLVFNEWLANALPGTPDWVELFNRSATQPVVLSGLTFGISNGWFRLRSLSVLAPRAYAQLYADEDPGPDHLDFKLSASGESLTVYDLAGQPVDCVSFGAQTEGVSQGRLPDGGGSIVSFPGSASPGAPNYLLAHIGPRLNELMARNGSVYDGKGETPDWLELHNSAGTRFDLAGLGLGTAPGGPPRFIFPSGAGVDGGGYLRVWCDSSRPASTNDGPDLNTGFALHGDGGMVCLFDAAGRAVDTLAYGLQATDWSVGLTGGEWRLLATPTPGQANSPPAALGDPAALRLNEWLSWPLEGEDDWLEIFNPALLPVNLDGLFLTDDPSIAGTTNSPIAPLSFVGPRGWVQFLADHTGGEAANQVPFALNRGGQVLRIYGPARQLIDSVEFGLGAQGVSSGRLPDGAAPILDFPGSPTPAASNYRPLANVLVNEVLAHSDPPFEDAIELYNPGTTEVALGGWYLSNSESDFKKYKIPASIVLPPRGYRVLYEYQFNSSNAAPFTLNSAHGDGVYVSEADAGGTPTGYRAQVRFGPTFRNVSVGRYVTSAGVDFVPLAARTFGADVPGDVIAFRTGTGATNAPPRVGPLVIGEILFHPVTWTGTNAAENAGEEFVEIQNLTGATVPLYDPAAPTNRWKLGGGVDFVFPGAASVPAGGFVLVAGFDPGADPAALAAFRAKYQVPPGVPVYGPFQGRLNNAGDAVELLRPDAPQAAPHPDAGFVPDSLVEQVRYGNRLPWPEGADGTGMSLQRRVAGHYGNEPANWLACAPTAGRPNCGTDADRDGLPDDWETANGLDPNSGTGPDGPGGDPDADGFTNYEEYVAGTHPRQGDSCLKIEVAGIVPEGVVLRFRAIAGHSYTVQFREASEAGSWLTLRDFEPPPATADTTVTDALAADAPPRFYRLVTPRLP